MEQFEQFTNKKHLKFFKILMIFWGGGIRYRRRAINRISRVLLLSLPANDAINKTKTNNFCKIFHQIFDLDF